MEMYDNENTVQRSFDIDFLTEYLVQAQWAEFIELKKIITELHAAKGNPISILDIGIGNARIPKHLSGIKEIWDMIERYDGTDNAQACIDISKKIIAEPGIQDKVNAFFSPLEIFILKIFLLILIRKPVKSWICQKMRNLRKSFPRLIIC